MATSVARTTVATARKPEEIKIAFLIDASPCMGLSCPLEHRHTVPDQAGHDQAVAVAARVKNLSVSRPIKDL
jgi:hypothetical protein